MSKKLKTEFPVEVKKNVSSAIARHSMAESAVYSIGFDFKFANDKVTILELCDGLSSDYSGFESAYGKDLKVLLIKELAKHYEHVFLVNPRPYNKMLYIPSNNGHINKKLFTEDNITICYINDLASHYDAKKHNKNNTVAVGLTWQINLDLLHYCACYHLNLTILSASDLLQLCFNDKAAFYLMVKDNLKLPTNIIPTTFIINKENYHLSLLEEIKGKYIILKPTSESEGCGVCVIFKRQADRIISLLFKGKSCFSKIGINDENLLNKLQELSTSFKINDEIVLQQMVNSDLVDDYDVTDRAVYNIYLQKKDDSLSFDINLLGIYRKLPLEVKKEKTWFNVSNIVSVVSSGGNVPRQFPEDKVKVVDKQLKEFIKIFLGQIHQIKLYDYMVSLDREKSPNCFPYFIKIQNIPYYRLDFICINSSSLTWTKMFIVQKQFETMIFDIFLGSADFKLINVTFLEDAMRAFNEFPMFCRNPYFSRLNNLKSMAHRFEFKISEQKCYDTLNKLFSNVVTVIQKQGPISDISEELTKLTAFIKYVQKNNSHPPEPIIEIRPYSVSVVKFGVWKSFETNKNSGLPQIRGRF